MAQWKGILVDDSYSGSQVQAQRKTIEILAVCLGASISVSVALMTILVTGKSLFSEVIITGSSAAIIVSLLVSIPMLISRKKVKREYNLLSGALDIVDATVVVYDENDRVILYNASAKRFYATRGVKLRKGMQDIDLHAISARYMYRNPEEQQQWFRDVMESRTRQLTLGQPLIVRLENPERYHQVLLASQNNGHYVEMRTDVTQLKKQELSLAHREMELEASRNEAQASSRAKSEFLANMSHEIRTPMNGVIGMTELLLESELNAEQRTYASTVSKSALALLTLINDILDFSKIEAGKLELDNAPFDLASAVEDVASLLAASASAKNVELAVDYSPDLPARFIGDAGRLRQIITNLVGNAVKFTEQGHVLVRIDGNVSNEIGHLSVAVIDTGIGIPEHKQDVVFSAFEQVDGASNRRFEGSGLGLAITRRLAKLMRSEIQLESSVGEGSTFTFSLQLPVDHSTEQTNAQSDPVELNGKSVLIVDDLPLNCDILKRRVDKWGMQPTIANNGREALEFAMEKAASGKPFDLAIFDYQMPDLDGHALCTKFKASPILESIPVIMLSSVDQSVQGTQIRKFGFAGTLLKPIRTYTLHQMISDTLREDTSSQDINNLSSDNQFEENLEIKKSMFDGKRILVVEDNVINQLVITGMLEKYGFAIEIADDGQAGVEAFKASRPDLILMDVSMPVMNGLDATTAIRSHEQTADKGHCPIIALTANAMSSDREKCLLAGMDDFLTKPVLLEDLGTMLEQWLDQGDKKNFIAA